MEVNDGPLGNVTALIRIDNVVEQFIPQHIDELGTLNSLQFVSAAREDSLLHEGEHDGHGLGLFRVVLAVEAFFGGAEDLREADGVAAKVVDQHVVGFALFADRAVVILSAPEYVDVALAFEQVVVVSTFETAPSVAVPLHALPDVEGAAAG